MPVTTSPFSQVAQEIKSIFDAEFAAEGFTMIFDKVHEALGQTRVEVGIAPSYDSVLSNNGLVQETWVEVRFLGLWRKEITPTTQIDPVTITVYAERFRDALRRASNSSSGQMWYYDVRRTDYPDDPTGNKSRFYMTIRAYGNNAGLVETAA